MKRRSSGKEKPPKKFSQFLTTPQQCLVDWLIEGGVPAVQSFFSVNGAAVLNFFDVYLHKSSKNLTDEERLLCQWYFLREKDSVLDEDMQFILLKQICENNYRFFFALLLQDEILFWNCKKKPPTIACLETTPCRMQIVLQQLVKLDCAWAVQEIVELVKREQRLHGPRDLSHTCVVELSTWKQTFPLQVWTLYPKGVVLGSGRVSFFLLNYDMEQYMEFTLEDLQQIAAQDRPFANRLLLTRIIRFILNDTSEPHRDYLQVLEQYTTNHDEIWTLVEGPFFDLLCFPVVKVYRALQRHFTAHKPSGAAVWAIDRIVGPSCPEYEILVSKHSGIAGELGLIVEKPLKQYMWKQFTIDDVKVLTQGQPAIVLMPYPLSWNLRSDTPESWNIEYLLLWNALVNNNPTVTNWLLKQWHYRHFPFYELPKKAWPLLRNDVGYERVKENLISERYEKADANYWQTMLLRFEPFIRKDPLHLQLCQLFLFTKEHRTEENAEFDKLLEELFYQEHA